MKLLVDTCTALWLATDDPELSPTARKLCLDPDNNLYLSVASAWEIAVKYSQRRLVLPAPPDEFVRDFRKLFRIYTLALVESAALHVARIPRHHKDPFDRILVCQSIVHGLAILSPDALLAQYPVRLLW